MTDEKFIAQQEKLIMERETFRYNAQEGMIKFGGSFVHALGHALAHADSSNTAKILRTWPDYCEEYAALWLKFMENRGKQE